MIKIIFGMCFLLIGNFCLAQNPKFPIFSDQRIPRPKGLRQIKVDEFSIDLARMDQYPDGIIYGNKQTLLKLGNFLKYQKEGKAIWKEQCDYVCKVLNQWDFLRSGFSANRYIYNLGSLDDLSLIYLFTGHKELGIFLKGHIMQVAGLPIEFWTHAELRGYNPEFPLGQLETAAACSGMGVALSVAGNLLTKEELAEAEFALRNKGLIPCMNWLKKPLMHNYSAVISSGALIAASYLKELSAKEEARVVLTRFLNETIEKDGSYGEGAGYFSYPISSLFSGILCLTGAERQQTFASSGLRNSSVWMAYQYFFNTSPEGKLLPHIVHFGDNTYSSSPSMAIIQILTSIYHDSLALWLKQKFNEKAGIKEMLLEFSSESETLIPKSPEENKLPLLQVFHSGDCYLRSSWEDNGIVLGLRSGDGSLVKFNHQRAELNSICMGAYGEYLLVSSGSASYRSPIHYLYDFSTRASNTITIDDKNQLFPTSGLNQWSNQLDNTKFWIKGTPKAKVIFSQTGENANILVNEAAEAYFPKMNHAQRAIIFVRDPGYFVMIDRMEAAVDNGHKFSMRLHFNNRDNQGKLEKVNNNQWLLNRPLANLGVYVFADKKLDSAIGKGYMHGEERDYSPGGENEGFEGSSVELEVFNSMKTNEITFFTVLFPGKKEMKLPRIKFQKNSIWVGNDKTTFDGENYILEKNGKTEVFKIN